MTPNENRDGLKEYPEATNFYAAACDINGVWRGKRLPIDKLEKVGAGEMRMPLSALGLDIWGRDIDDNPLVFETGDQDGICKPTERGLLPMALGGRKNLLYPLWMVSEAGAASPVDARQILASAVDRAHGLGFNPVMATELEFYLVDPLSMKPRPPKSPVTKREMNMSAILGIYELGELEAFFDAVYENCRLQDIAVETAISEAGLGQFELNLLHSDDPLRAADDAVFFKRIVKAAARHFDMAASFMAKPYLDRPGSGLHVHFSLLDEKGHNLFDDGGEMGTDMLRHAVGGLMVSLGENALLWAPHLNSYRRLQPSSHAPTGICWGYENRTAAVRIPGGSPKARRIEHRVAGADANPYLVLAAIIHGALDGIENKIEPPKALEGDAYSAKLERLPQHWIDAIRRFESGDFAKKHFSEVFHEVFTKAKYQEYQELTGSISEAEINSYLEIV